MQKDADAVRVEVTEMNHRYPPYPLEKQDYRRCVPAGNVSEEPSLERGQIAPCAEIFHQQDSADCSLERKPFFEGALRNRNLAEHFRHGCEIRGTTPSSCDEPRRWTQSYVAVVRRLGIPKRS